METQKRIKGSAIVDNDGFFLFTPYKTGESEKNMRLVKATKNASLWRGKQVFSARLRWPIEKLPPLQTIVACVMDLYNEAKTDVNKK